MIRIDITKAANERGERYVWLAPNVVNRLRAMRGPGESYSDVILRLRRRANGSQKSPALLGAAARAESARRDCQRSIVSFDWPFDNLGFLSENFR